MAIPLVRRTTNGTNRFQISIKQFNSTTHSYNSHPPLQALTTAQHGSRTAYQRCSGDTGWRRS